jgi:carboxynorspermidine decarboxylase
MARNILEGLDIADIETPVFIVDKSLLRRNLATLDSVMQRTGCHILLALKGYAMHSTFGELNKTLKGICASSTLEARLGREEFGGEVHAFAPAYSEADIREHLTLSDHLVFNSLAAWHRFKPMIQSASRPISCGLRVNPERSVGKVALYDPSAPRSRLGIRAAELTGQNLDGISGLHFHALCEQNSHDLKLVLEAFEEKFHPYIGQMKWINFGGGHHITRDDYDVELLCQLITGFKKRHNVKLYLEPGEAVALNTGYLIASVLDIVDNDGPIAILDTSASAHMPDVLEMPYRPMIVGSGEAGEKKHTYRLGGLTCLAGDVIGDYSFDEPLQVGSKLVFLDMAHYSMVKTTMFNGVKHPALALYDSDTKVFEIVRKFGYQDYKNRLS